ncbi:hypothetical protein [Croceitalea rosinachiae]|uniref:Flap endonuclease-1-like 5' DNA nuclease n=1 Tax=Croceitalea rosinachiae TaxID=3075596 RepID=A0ABU3A9B2_9FLAO|nr:hypothetical protein [Croceitalea sp. F388]MDT0606480.1 hypothetical protein [Croceitalea sp. F388]
MNFDNIWCWLIPLLVGAICGIIGYYWGKGKSDVIDNSPELKALENENASLKADLDACNKKLAVKPVAKPAKSKVASSLAAGSAAMAFDAAAAKAAFGKKIKQDDLKIVEGIGPKIEGLFHNFDIKTWQALSDATVAKCQEVLDSGGKRYQIHDPASWPMQAKMAFKGDWKKLAKWQDEHKAGKL